MKKVMCEFSLKDLELGGLLGGKFDILPWQTVSIEIGHEGIGVVLFYVPDTGFAPIAG